MNLSGYKFFMLSFFDVFSAIQKSFLAYLVFCARMTEQAKKGIERICLYYSSLSEELM